MVIVQGRDGTLEEVEARRSALIHLTVHHSDQPMGVGAAVRCAMAMLNEHDDLVLMLDADLSHRPEDLLALYDGLTLHNADLVVGSRYVPGGSAEGIRAWKRLASLWTNKVISLLLGIPIKDKTSGYRLIDATLARRVSGRVRSSGFAFNVEFLAHACAAGSRPIEIPICYRPRNLGSSKMQKLATITDYLALMWNLL